MLEIGLASQLEIKIGSMARERNWPEDGLLRGKREAVEGRQEKLVLIMTSSEELYLLSIDLVQCYQLWSVGTCLYEQF